MNELDMFTPRVLTSAVEQIKPDPRYLTELFANANSPVLSPTEEVLFDVVTGRYDLAPMGFPGDPASVANYSESIETKTVVPPQILLDQPISARDVNRARSAGQATMVTGNAAGASLVVRAFQDMVQRKQKNLVNSIERRVEWMISKVLSTGKIEYTNPHTGRRVDIDFSVPNGNKFTAAELWSADTTDVFTQLYQWSQTFVRLNGISPTTFICGSNAATALLKNKSIRDWLKTTQGSVINFSPTVGNNGVNRLLTVSNVGTIVSYGAEYTDGGSTGKYIPDDYLIITVPSAYRFYYGAISDFDLGDNPLFMGRFFSKQKTSEDGKTRHLYVQSNPLPVLEKSAALMIIKVV